MSRDCDRKVRQALAAEAERGGFNAEQQEKALKAIRSGEVKPLARSLYSVPSAKGDGTRYASDGNSCTCPDGARTHPRGCWHRLAARVFAVLAPAARVAVPTVTVPAPAKPADDEIWARLEQWSALEMAMA